MARKLCLSLGGTAAILVILGAGPMTIRTDGLKFPDGTIQATAAAADPRRAYYLTASGSQGDQATDACAPGFHLASIWEILDMSALRYATEIGDAEIHADAGQGPPTGKAGWVRTGYQFGNVGPVPGRANCSLWTTNASASNGTIVSLPSDWGPDTFGKVQPWNNAVLQCNVFSPAWCVEDAQP